MAILSSVNIVSKIESSDRHFLNFDIFFWLRLMVPINRLRFKIKTIFLIGFSNAVKDAMVDGPAHYVQDWVKITTVPSISKMLRSGIFKTASF